MGRFIINGGRPLYGKIRVSGSKNAALPIIFSSLATKGVSRLYNLPDISGYAADLSASMTASAATEIIVPVNINGREVARASAWFMNEQLAWEAR